MKQKLWFYVCCLLFVVQHVRYSKELLKLYGKSLIKLIYKKLALDFFFFNIIIFCELRLSTLVLRMFFFSNFFEVYKKIFLGLFTVNSKKSHKNFLVPIGSLIKYLNVTKSLLKFRVINRLVKWKWRHWRKWIKFCKKRRSVFKKFPSFFKKLRSNVILNYIEILYKYKLGILLYKPVLGEILLANKKRMLSMYLVKNKKKFIFFRFLIFYIIKNNNIYLSF